MLRNYTVLQSDMERTPTGEHYETDSHQQAWLILAGMLAIDGPRCLLARSEEGVELRASLYDGEDYIIGAGGQTLPLP